MSSPNARFNSLVNGRVARIGWMLVILFATVGNFMGHTEGAVTIVIVATTIWTATRMVCEGIMAFGSPP